MKTKSAHIFSAQIFLFSFFILFLLSCSSPPVVKPAALPAGKANLVATQVDESLLPKHDSEITPFGAGKILIGDSVSKIQFDRYTVRDTLTSVYGTEKKFFLVSDKDGNVLIRFESDAPFVSVNDIVVFSPHYKTPRGFFAGMKLRDVLLAKEKLHPYSENSELRVTLEYEGVELIPDSATQRRYFSDPEYQLEKDSLAFISRIEI